MLKSFVVVSFLDFFTIKFYLSIGGLRAKNSRFRSDARSNSCTKEKNTHWGLTPDTGK